VATAVGQSGRRAPQPLNDFNPLRAGALKLLRLRLVDCFGQTREVQCDQVITTEVMTVEAQPQLIALPPRLAQPARLNFRWLAAELAAAEDGDEPEMNSHPATSPICGWLLPNHLDNSLMVYAQSGRALGSITAGGQWLHAPGHRPLTPGEIPNRHLKQVVTYLLNQNEAGGGFLNAFFEAIEKALENIHPEEAAHHDALALLLGRPMAVVRASLNLELLGRAAVNQDWNVFRRDMVRPGKEADFQGIQHPVRDTDRLTHVRFPIRLGENRQLNDGLIGYWLEDGNGYKDNKFYAPQSVVDSAGQNNQHPDIVLHQEGRPCNIEQRLADRPRKLTMLVDPLGAVHATCGVLPAKAIRIPADQFAPALSRLELHFLSTPILTAVAEIQLPLPDEPGYAWSWLAKENGVWAESAAIGPAETQATFAGRQAIREGWLKLSKREEV
jgi:hypothetical protein